MAREPEPLFYEEQRFLQARVRILTAIPPAGMLLIASWQIALGHKWGKQPMSNAAIVGWTIFLGLIYLRLMTVKLVIEVYPGELRVAMRGLWRSMRVPLTKVQAVEVVTFHPLRDWGGYGIRSSSRGRAYLASGEQGVELQMASGGIVLIGSRRPADLAGVLRTQVRRSA